MRVLVTGGAGFIGSHFVKLMLSSPDVSAVTVLDALTYAGSIGHLGEAFLSPKLAFCRGDIRDAGAVNHLVAEHDAVVHFAAESHVDRSLAHAGTFVSTNVTGTYTLLEAARHSGIRRFVHVSTDEVYGPLPSGAADEEHPLRPTVPYAASKASSDLLVLSYHRTYGLPVSVTRVSNNYGPHQHPEKMIPKFVTSLLRGERITLHGHGEHVRDWLHVTDHCRGIELVLRRGEAGGVYNIGAGTGPTNAEVTDHLLALCGADRTAVRHIPDRQANDGRYAMRTDRIRSLGWEPRRTFDEGLAETVAWYRNHPHTWAPMLRPEPTPALAGPTPIRR